jgi:hypothetical protein
VGQTAKFELKFHLPTLSLDDLCRTTTRSDAAALPTHRKIPLTYSIFEDIGQFPIRFPAWMGYFGGSSQPILANGL